MGSTSGASSHFSAKNPVKQAALEHCQPEELNRFRSNRRIEEHLLTANLVIDKTLDSCPSCPSCAWRLPSTTIRAQTEAGKRSGAKKKKNLVDWEPGFTQESWIAWTSLRETFQLHGVYLF